MNSILAFLALVLGVCIVLLAPQEGGPALIFAIALAGLAGLLISRAEVDKKFLLRIFVMALLARLLIATLIYYFSMQNFFGGDAMTYDYYGYAMMKVWQGEVRFTVRDGWFTAAGGGGTGMVYLVGAIYYLLGRNPLAIQFFNAVVGAATAPIIFLCAHHIFRNSRVSRIATYFVAFYPSLILWSSQGLKDAPIVFMLSLSMLATLKLGEKLNVKYFVILIGSLLGILSMRFYIFYMLVVAIGGAFMIGMRALTAQSLIRQFVMILGIGLSLTYLGVMRTASVQIENYASLETIQNSRATQARLADTGFGKDVDVSTTSGALSLLPVGLTYLLFAPFPWQLASLRQSITLPEMVVWWGSFPMLILGLWFTIKYRLRQVLPILMFTTMLSLAYSLVQGNVGTAYRQRAQLLVFYFIFVAVGYVLLKERREEQKRHALAAKQSLQARQYSQKI